MFTFFGAELRSSDNFRGLRILVWEFMAFLLGSLALSDCDELPR